MDFLHHLAQQVERTGHTLKHEKSSFLVEPLNLRIECEIGGKDEHNVNGKYSVVYNVGVKATHPQLFPDGIWDTLAGFGASDDEAFSYAAEVWTSGVFLPLHEILVPTETVDFGVPRLDLVSRNEDTGEEFAWKLYLGGLHVTGEFLERTDTLKIDILPQKMLNAIVSELYEKKLIWIKSYISKLPDGSVHGDCWLNNQNWIEGVNALYWFTEEWGEVKSYASMKQFMIIKPCEWSESENAARLKQALPPAKKQGFLGKWFGK